MVDLVFNEVKIHSKLKEYSVESISDLLQNKEKVFCNVQYNRPFYFIDANVYRLYKNNLERFIGDDFFLIIDAVETSKEYRKLTEYYAALIEGGFTRKDVLVTFGGGILQDISGFIASTLYRGIPWIFFPTTLLAQADSCIGSKTSINFGDAKNLIGTFYPPDFIGIDVGFCTTLTPSFFNSGLGEIIKYHLMVDDQKYRLLKEYLSSPDIRDRRVLDPILWSSLEIKYSYFSGDEFDTGRRNLLNYGHCFGHALESASNFAVSHGEAVIVGMGFANLFSLKRGIMRENIYNDIESLLRNYYPHFLLSDVSFDTLLQYLKRDKKRVGKDLTMILAEGIGVQRKCDDITEEEMRTVHRDFCKRYSTF